LDNGNFMHDEQRHPIKVVVRQTGLTPHAIRVWERRHGAVTPLRTPTNRRLDSDADIERLRTLRHLTHAGYSIGRIAQLPAEQLQALIRADDERPGMDFRHARGRHAVTSVTSYLEACLDAIQPLDAEALERTLAQAAVALSQPVVPVVMEKIVAPLMQQMGELWHTGVLRMTHEHLASAVVRNFLWNLSESYATSPQAPQLIVTTPAGQLHEIGALMVAVTARGEGWGVMYLGPNLPAEEIAAAVQPGVKAVALSIMYPPDDARLLLELTKLRRYLPPGIRLLVGGRAAVAYERVLTSIGAIQATTLTELKAQLEALRWRRPCPTRSSLP
jgi:DNA-binding transcriptional MerR regulator/methylmalonyl-CoA mutase cobalamin-binding subunit